MRIFYLGVAKNVILFLGDGMSVPTFSAARVYMSQLSKEGGEESQVSFEKFPYTGLSKVYFIKIMFRISDIKLMLYFLRYLNIFNHWN